MKGTDGYAVFLFPQALEALGEAVKPYLTENAHGAHVVCTGIDTAGALVQMTVDGVTAEGQALQLQLMVPSSMVRMIVSARGEEAFGFRPRAVATAAGVPPDVPEGSMPETPAE